MNEIDLSNPEAVVSLCMGDVVGERWIVPETRNYTVKEILFSMDIGESLLGQRVRLWANLKDEIEAILP